MLMRMEKIAVMKKIRSKMGTEREKDRNGKEREKRNRAVKGTTKEKRKKCFVKYIGLGNFPKFIFPESKLYLK